MLGLFDSHTSDWRRSISQLLLFGSVLSSAYMLWKGLGVVMNTDSPIVVVLSGSMSPAFERGDILFVHRQTAGPPKCGDIIVFSITGKEIPIVHRVVKAHEERYKRSAVKLLTKGDHNNIHDRGLYANNALWLEGGNVIGKVYGCLPFAGMMTILMNDYPKFKMAFLLAMGLMTVFGKDQ